MRGPRGGAHQQLPVHGLVPRPVARLGLVELADHVRRVEIERGCHTHTFASAVERKQVWRMAHDETSPRRGRHRNRRNRITATRPLRPCTPNGPVAMTVRPRAPLAAIPRTT